MTPEQEVEYQKLIAKAALAKAALGKLAVAIGEARALSPIPYRFGRVTPTQKREDASVEGLQRRLYAIEAAPADMQRRLQREAELAEKKAAQDAAAAAEAAKLQARAAEATRLKNAAVQWLLDKGKVLGVDFNVDDAVEIANEIAFEEEANRLAEKDGFYEFDGDDNCDSYGDPDPETGEYQYCKGWDGSSHRCDCGNRRVSWTASWDHSFEHPSLRGEAY